MVLSDFLNFDTPTGRQQPTGQETHFGQNVKKVRHQILQ